MQTKEHQLSQGEERSATSFSRRMLLKVFAVGAGLLGMLGRSPAVAQESSNRSNSDS